ncbi:MAG: sigma-70 family RNA polymerase sigma factor [Nannocystaceae bacterium]|nr:sigma-70 family RNA polymerase sigma factor [Nannocystaceae bacterium]
MGPVPYSVVISICSIGIGLVVVFVPALDALRRLVGMLIAGLRVPTRARTTFALSEEALHPALPPPYRTLAQDTRSVLASLEHADMHATAWSDEPRRKGWAWRLLARSDTAYTPTIGMTGEVWRWLQQAEALAEGDEPWADRLRIAAATVRRTLLSERPLVVRLDAIAHLLVAVDRDLRIHGGTPYRDALAPHDALPITDARSATGEENRAQRYVAVLAKYGTSLRAMAARFSNGDAEAEDLLQEIHLAIWTALPHFRGDCSERTYVLRVARNRGENAQRQRQALNPACDPPDPAPGADERIDHARRKSALAAAIEALPRKLREAVRLRLDGLSYREIGACLGVTETNASVRVTRARRALHRDLTPDCS